MRAHPLILALYIAASWLSCAQPANPLNRQAALINKQTDGRKSYGVDTALRIVRTGDMVLRRGSDATSYMFSRMNRKELTYSHCGIVIFHNGYPYVYHAIGGEDNPDALLRADSLTTWMAPKSNELFGIYRHTLSVEELRKLVSVVTGYYKDEVKFDTRFDLNTDDRLYCAELVAKALNRAKGMAYIQPSKRYGLYYYSIDDLYLTASGKLIWQVTFK
ncbi:MAG: hypothetical protein EOP49_35790 [Sphingobacteriales bacterium]|nr:MAG: hypothetical protein EOP49_35790 [Sphingobacteriales bacterium]